MKEGRPADGKEGDLARAGVTRDSEARMMHASRRDEKAKALEGMFAVMLQHLHQSRLAVEPDCAFTF